VQKRTKYLGSESMERTVKPELVFIRIDETEYWDAEFLKDNRIKKIWSIYLYDYREHTHLCEMTPSYCLWYVDFSVEFEDDVDHDDTEEAYDKVMESQCEQEPCQYAHVAVIDKHDDENKDTNNPIDDDEDWRTPEGYRALLDQYIEDYRGNPTL